MTTIAPKTQGGRALKRGDSFDIECWRTTHRLRIGQQILSGFGITPTYEHTEACPRHPDRLKNVVHAYRDSVCCSSRDCGRDYKGAEWPEWVTGETFDLAYALADEVQTNRGAYEQRRAREAKEARKAVTA